MTQTLEELQQEVLELKVQTNAIAYFALHLSAVLEEHGMLDPRSLERELLSMKLIDATLAPRCRVVMQWFCSEMERARKNRQASGTDG